MLNKIDPLRQELAALERQAAETKLKVWSLLFFSLHHDKLSIVFYIEWQSVAQGS